MLEHTAGLWHELRGEQLLITGGTGFFGRWLVESFVHANRVLRLHAHLCVVSRNPRAFCASAPHLGADAPLSFVEGDVRSFAFPAGRFACVIHAATDSVLPAGASAQEQYSVIVDGTRRALAFAAGAGVARLLLMSSGAVYGPQPLSVDHVGEEQPFAPTENPYALGKRAAEAMCMEAGSGLAVTVARGFAFLGPHLPLDAHFAAGNFLRDALAGRPLVINGDGTPLRSYLYPADLAVWLWTILLRGRSGRAYNVGAEEPVSIAALAEKVASTVAPGLEVRTAHKPGPGVLPARYVPCTKRAREELGLGAWIGLDEAICRTAAWHRAASSECAWAPYRRRSMIGSPCGT